MIDTNHKLSDLQFSQIMSYLSDVALPDPIKSYQYHRFMRTRRIFRAQQQIANMLSHTPKIRKWTSAENSSIIILKGSFRTRLAIKDFCTGVVEKLRSKDGPVIWALSDGASQSTAPSRNSIDLLKYLTYQAVQISQKLKNEKSMALTCHQCRSASSAKEWFQILQQALTSIGHQIYILLDMGLLSATYENADYFCWSTAFADFFTTISDRGLNTNLKVLLLTYNPLALSQLVGMSAPSFVVPVKNSNPRSNKGRFGWRRKELAIR